MRWSADPPLTRTSLRACRRVTSTFYPNDAAEAPPTRAHAAASGRKMEVGPLAHAPGRCAINLRLTALIHRGGIVRK